MENMPKNLVWDYQTLKWVERDNHYAWYPGMPEPLIESDYKAMCENVKPDMVNHPPHYRASPSGIEVIELTEHMNFCLGSAVKYIMRCDHKGDPVRDLEKAVWFLQREIARRNKYV